MRKITYTTKLHVHRLELMLNRPDICEHCPAVPKTLRRAFISYLISYKNPPCPICTKFVGYEFTDTVSCPCHQLKDKAIPLTLKAIQKYRKETT